MFLVYQKIKVLRLIREIWLYRKFIYKVKVTKRKLQVCSFLLHSSPCTIILLLILWHSYNYYYITIYVNNWWMTYRSWNRNNGVDQKSCSVLSLIIMVVVFFFREFIHLIKLFTEWGIFSVFELYYQVWTLRLWNPPTLSS